MENLGIQKLALRFFLLLFRVNAMFSQFLYQLHWKYSEQLKLSPVAMEPYLLTDSIYT